MFAVAPSIFATPSSACSSSDTGFLLKEHNAAWRFVGTYVHESDAASPYNSLLYQRLLQYQRQIIVMQQEFATFLDWEVLGNHPVHVPPQCGTAKFKRPTFTTQAYHMKINHVRAPRLSIATGGTGGHLLRCQTGLCRQIYLGCRHETRGLLADMAMWSMLRPKPTSKN